mmetsp:Transcript_42088/g.117190  ORF Transcript_42088/g.117190 Transcript_42088/m.117190 type:complete len:236 (-) Transcript_42088:865-1572(-)
MPPQAQTLRVELLHPEERHLHGDGTSFVLNHHASGSFGIAAARGECGGHPELGPGEAQEAGLADGGSLVQERNVVPAARVLLGRQSRVELPQGLRHLGGGLGLGLPRRGSGDIALRLGRSGRPLPRGQLPLAVVHEELVAEIKEAAGLDPLVAGRAAARPLQRHWTGVRGRARTPHVVGDLQHRVCLEGSVGEALTREHVCLACALPPGQLITQANGGGKEEPQAVLVVHFEVQC